MLNDRLQSASSQSFIISLTILLSLGCTTSRPLLQSPTQLSINSLSAINLSEDMNQASSQQDEILLVIYSIQNKVDAPRFKDRRSREYTFKKRQEQFEINLRLPTDDSTIIGYLFFLVELDETNSSETVMETLDLYLNTRPIAQFKNLEIDEALGHDDFLDKYFLDFSKPLPKQIQFKGLQMFDRYEYKLNIDY